MDRKKILFDELTPYLKHKGYQSYLTGGAPTYALITSEIIISFFFNFRSNGEIGTGPLGLTNCAVEDFILKVGTPSIYIEMPYSIDKKYPPATVEFRELPQAIIPRPILTEGDVKEYATSYKRFLENEGANFINRYSYLPNILEEMNRLESNGDDWNGILFGMGDRLFRGIIISKLCNDLKYLEKLDYCNMKFSTVQLLKEWQPYWEKLKTILPTIEPKYNL